METNFDLRIAVIKEIVDGQLCFNTTFNRTLTATENSLMPSVNLSRGGKRMYRLDKLADHNGTGASWNDGNNVIHNKAAFDTYKDRVKTDISVAWTIFKAAVIKVNTPEVVVTADGKSLFFAANGQ